MKICVIGIDSASPEVVFQDERLTNLRRLMDAGLFGLLQSPASSSSESAWQCLWTSREEASGPGESIWQYLAQQGKKTQIVESPESSGDNILAASSEQWQEAVRRLSSEEWDGFQFVDFGLARMQVSNGDDTARSDYYVGLDEQMVGVMETMDDQTILLVVSPGAKPEQPGFFVLAAPNCPLSGEHEGANLLDMAPTLLDLAGYAIPAPMQGRSLVAGMEKLVPGNEDHEKIIYDRLAGLGYV